MIKRKLALSIKNSRLGPLLVKLGIRKWRFARKLYGKLTKINKKHPIKVGKYKIFLDENDSLGLLRKKDFYKKSYPSKIMKKFVKKGDNVIDIGANIGVYTLLLADIIGKKGKVYSFEPDPNNFKTLVKNIKINGFDNVIPIEKAISEKTGNLKLFLAEFNKGDHRIYSSDEKRKSINIKTITLDDYFKKNKKKIKFIKMDIQGAEVFAFEGGRDFFKKQKPIILQEFWPIGIESSGKDYVNFLKFLNKKHNLYSEKELNKKMTQREILTKVSAKKRNHINLLCIPK